MADHLHRSGGSNATAQLASFFDQLGAVYTEAEQSLAGPDMDGEIIKDGVRYAVEVKSLSEGRTDRVIPLLSQAILQAQRYAAERKGAKPKAVLYVAQAPDSMFKTCSSCCTTDNARLKPRQIGEMKTNCSAASMPAWHWRLMWWVSRRRVRACNSGCKAMSESPRFGNSEASALGWPLKRLSSGGSRAPRHQSRSAPPFWPPSRRPSPSASPSALRWHSTQSSKS